MAEVTAQHLAEQICTYLYEQDYASQTLGIQISQISPGEVMLTMPVRQDMINGMNICHGGIISALADTALAFACNTENILSIVSSFTMEFILPAQQGDVLAASTKAIAKTGRTMLYDVNVYNQHQQLIATLRGRVQRLLGKAVLNQTRG